MSAQDTVFSQKTERLFDRKAGNLTMGILNVTPDSFHDGGKYNSEEKWLEQAQKMINEGADIIDIGAYSTRPGATDISQDEEINRLIPAIRSVRKAFPNIHISADTFRASIARKAVEAGADILNDVGGGTLDAEMFNTVAELQVPYVLMHIRGTPQNMQDAPHYEDVLKEVMNYFEERIAQLKELGFSKIILDPGFGFGKTVEHNIQILKNLEQFNRFGFPILIGLSRKSIINKILNISSKDSLNGTSILNTLAIQNGARILRVHDVKEAVEVVRLVNQVSGNGYQK